MYAGPLPAGQPSTRRVLSAARFRAGLGLEIGRSGCVTPAAEIELTAHQSDDPPHERMKRVRA